MRIALGAGHGIFTPGKRNMKALDPFETREWVMNNKIVSGVEERLKEYDVEVLRVDDRNGIIDVPLAERVKAVNNFNPDIYVSYHHNAGANGSVSGGIEVYVANLSSQASKDYQKIIYNKLIEHTQLRGNRASPMQSANFYVLVNTRVPAVLVEHGYMDSRVDVPIILSEKFVNQCIDAHVESLVEYLKLQKKVATETNKLYRVQVGAYSVKANADQLLMDLKSKGFNGIITEENINKEETIITKSKYYKIGDAHIIETSPDNIYVKVLGNNLHSAKAIGVNGVLYDTKTAPVTSPESCVFIAMNDGKAISNNSQFNGYKGPPRATLIYHKNKQLGFRQLKDITPIKDNTIWAVGGYMVKPYMDFANEKIPGTINYKTAHTYIGYKGNTVYLIVKPNHMISEIVSLMDQLGITNSLVLDGGGSSQMNHPNGQYKSDRKINTAILLKEI